ncbi:hypothetical protein D9Q98_001425 [Chlorella vulgaris]|uniref:Embryonic stem cell-specific 5-hydroxymethylcytosine-binding protein n=1 Tax=Chlorella vulgaris TaxID=3077 RepID=A0A9D4Z224_CHLVU|nr:hypothetical protein D9Q98_001425 [Chlorella vulgaris]
MCGRARCTLGAQEVLRTARASDWIDQESYQPSYNAAPGACFPVVRSGDGGEPVVHTMRWGLVPSFTKPGEKPNFFRMFNARSETVAEKASFRRLIPARRCLIPVDGFYEWVKEKDGKQPYYVHLSTGEPLVFAGLWDTWQSAEGTMHSFTILTCDSCKRLDWLHDRMPVVLRTPEAQQRWLRTDDKDTLGTLHKLYVPYNGEDLVWHPVTRQMNTFKFQGPECCKELKIPSAATFFAPRSAKAAGAASTASCEPRSGDGKEAGVGGMQQVAADVEPEVKQEPGISGQGHAAASQHVKQEVQDAPAAINTDEKPAGRQTAAPTGAAEEQTAAVAVSSTGAAAAPSQETPQKRKATDSSAASPAKSSGAGKGSAKKAKLPGQRDITSFFHK